MKIPIALTMALTGVIGAAAWAAAPEDSLSTYQEIVERNAFGLKDPPPPPEQTATQQVAQVNIQFTGITTTFGVKKAYFRIPDSQKPGTFLYPCIKEGEREGTIEVVQIDDKTGAVKIRNAGNAMTLTFETHRIQGASAMVGGGPGVPGAPGIPGAPGGMPAGAQPNPTPAGQPMPSLPANVNPSGIAPATAAQNPSAIPSRTLRTGSAFGGSGSGNIGNQAAVPATKSPETDAINFEIIRATQPDSPPLPPITD